MEHVGKDDWQAFFFSAPNRALHARVASHLFEGCGDCLERAREVLAVTGGLEVADNRQALSILLHESALLKDETRKAEGNWVRLALLDEKTRDKTMMSRWRFKKLGLATYVLDEAERLLARGKRDKAKELVRISAAVTSCLPPRVYGLPLLADLKLRQETVLSNISRLSLDFMGALEALQRADKARHQGIDLVEKARFFRVQGMLLFDLGEFEEGAKAARARRLLHEEMHDLKCKGRALLQEAMILAQFDPVNGLARANQGLDLLKPSDCHPFVSGVFYKAYCLLKLGGVEDASKIVSDHRELVHQDADPGMELWFRYLDALILHSKGKTKDAEAILIYTALRFREEGLFLWHDGCSRHLLVDRLRAGLEN